MYGRYVFITWIILLSVFQANAQQRSSLSLNEAYALLEDRYPLLQNEAVIAQIFQKEMKKLDISQRPDLYWKADGRLQSESTSLDAEGGMLPFEIDQPLVSIR